MKQNPLHRFGLPATVLKSSDKDWKGKTSVLEAVDSWCSRTRCSTLRREAGYHLFLTGGGCGGKTFLSARILRAAQRFGFSCEYHRIPLYLDRIFAYYRGDDVQLVKDSLRPYVLVLEDIGREPLSGYPHTRKFLSLALVERPCGTVLTSRFSLSDIRHHYGTDLSAEIEERCLVVSCPTVASVLASRQSRKDRWMRGGK